MLLILFLFHITKSVEIFYGNIENKYFLNNISGVELNENIFPEKYITKMTIFYYYPNETQIEEVNSFPVLKEIIITNVNQTNVPDFHNVSQLTYLQIFVTQISIIRKNKLNGELKKLVLKNNRIYEIENGSFGWDLENINLRCNKIDKFNKNWFKTTKKLKVLNLGGNKITAIQENAFVEFSNLKNIDLSYNKIHMIGNGAFVNGVTDFQQLFLNNNKLKNISENIFGKKIKVKYFSINTNFLSCLPKKLLKTLSVYTKMQIEGN